MSNDKPKWEVLYEEAIVAVKKAQEAIDDIAGWSGSSGNWPLQESSGRINAALSALNDPHKLEEKMLPTKLTIVKVLDVDGNITTEDLERWRQIFAENKMTLEEAVATGEVVVEELPICEDSITIVKIGNEGYKPTIEDLKAWRDVFELAENDPDFKIFTHDAVDIKRIPMSKIVGIE